jgi:hypothetical protein
MQAPISPTERIIVALDLPSEAAAIALINLQTQGS